MVLEIGITLSSANVASAFPGLLNPVPVGVGRHETRRQALPYALKRRTELE
jgi:hypothetical protein